MSENPQPGLDEIHGSLTAPLLPSLEGSDVLGAPAPFVPVKPTNPTLPTLDWNPTAPSSVVSMPPPTRVPAPGRPVVSDETQPLDVEHPASTSAPESSVPPVDEPSVAPPPVAPTPVAPALPSDPAVAATPAEAIPVEPAIAAGAPSLPALAPAMPAPPAASILPPTFASAYDTPTTRPIATHRARDAIGGIVRTLLVAALVAGAVFGGRYAWDWNEERHSEAAVTEVLPATPVPGADVRFVQFRGGPGGSVTAHVDLASADYVADFATTQLARRSGEYWMRNIADGTWVPASAEFLESVTDERNAAEQASLLMITDVIPVGAQPYVTVSADEVVTLAGEAIPGPEVIEVDSPDIDGQGIDEQQAAAVPAGVVTRHVTLTIDRVALGTVDAALAESSGLGGTSPLVLDIWVDATGVVWKMTAPAGESSLVPDYVLISAAQDGAGPLADLGLPGEQPVPAAEAAG